MPRIKVDRFLGIVPKIEAHLLSDAQAQIATDTKLWSEGVRTFFGLANPEVVDKVGEQKRLYRFNDTWLTWTQDVDVVRGPLANDALEKTYFTGTDKPRVTANDIFDDGTVGTNRPPDSYILGIPAPTAAPVATDHGAGSITETCAWVMTFVRKWSDDTVEESAPSPASNVLALAAHDADVTLPAGTMATPGDYGITHKRLYRSDATVDGAGVYLLVAEETFATATVTDSTETADRGPELESTLYLPPPDEMIGLIVLPNGITAGFLDNTVYLSEPYKPHAYPLANQYTVNWPIVAIGAVGTSIVVATEAYPFIGRGADPANYVFRKHPGHFPCVSKRSMASSHLGAIWATTAGLAVSDGSSVELATRSFMTRDEWTEFEPTTIHAVVHDGRYYAWFTTGDDVDGNPIGGGFILDMSERAYLHKLGTYHQAAQSTDEGDLFVIDGTDDYAIVWQFDRDRSNPESYTWRSKKFVGALENYGYARIRADYTIDTSDPSNNGGLSELITLGAELNGMALDELAIASNSDLVLTLDDQATSSLLFRYYADEVLVYERVVDDDLPFPLPSGFMARIHEFEVSGNANVRSVELATSMEELLV